jgi:[acyl-carrier-protein] S-malonyltransferase
VGVVTGAALLFPGQGSQRPGMGRAFHDASAAAREVFARADEVLGFPLSSLCFDGPAAELRRTENAQPALFTVGAAACALLCSHGVEPVPVAGHSVGEYAALAAAGALTFEDGLRVVRRRGELMAEAADRRPGAMAAIIGLPAGAVERLCADAGSGGTVDIANENAPLQTVISGDVSAVHRVIELAEQFDGVLAVPLDVAGAFHSRLMAPAAQRFAELLSELPIRVPRVPIVANVTADYVRSPAAIREALRRQLDGRVRWRATIQRLAADGAAGFIEVGPGRTLVGLARLTAPGLAATTAEDFCRTAAATAEDSCRAAGATVERACRTAGAAVEDSGRSSAATVVERGPAR